jgi:hypothetical protein
MPAMDVINLDDNEKDAKKDFSLAFIGWYFNFRLGNLRAALMSLIASIR